MVIWKSKERHIEFVSYDGEYPNLCRGTLTLKINDQMVTFGSAESNFGRFWYSSGGITSDYTAYSGEWEIHEELLPKQFRKYAAEIDNFNENVEFGCCGGCI